MKPISYAELPTKWALCITENCPQEECCLRHVSHVRIPSRVKFHTCVLPSACSKDGHCPMFAAMDSVAVAWGMTTLLTCVRREDVRSVRKSLIELFGNRRRYYRFREGRWPIGPEMQEAIAQVMRSHGYTSAPHFDRTERRVFFPGQTDYVFPLDNKV